MKNILFTVLIFTLLSCSEKQQENQAGSHPDKFIKAAHYFAAAWPKTFWQEFEQGKVDKDLKQIKQDGFNTIILVLPWMGFELGFENKSTSSNAKMYQRLDFLLAKIALNKLDYILRLGFPHDFSPGIGTNATELCTSIYENPEHSKWLDYLKKVKSVTNNYDDNMAGVLVSWEDFWCPHFVFPHHDENRRRQLAQTTGYAQWLMKKDKTLLKIILGKNILKQTEISLPTKEDMDYFYYIEFIDKKFDELVLKTTKSVFPQAAMEIRIDKDPASSSTTEKIWVEHDLYFDEPNHRGTYWAPFWGANNQGEKLTLEQALFNFEYFLNYATNQGQSINHVVEQFNFTDNTPYFPNNASLNDDDVNDFLIQSIPLLKKYSSGYGVWAYRDYADNAIYNASFEFGLDGWHNSNVSIIGDDLDQQLKLSAGGFISQQFRPHERFMLARSYQQLILCINAETLGNLSVYASDKLVRDLILNPGKNCFNIKANKFIKENAEFKLMAQSDLIIDEIKLYGFVQKLGVYDENNYSGPYLKAIQQVNTTLVN